MVGFRRVGRVVFATGLLGVAAGAITLSAGALGDFWGSRGITDLYNFQYCGRAAAVQRDDRIWAPDRYWIALERGDGIHSGRLVSDEGKEICIGSCNPSKGHYLVRDFQK